MLVLMGRANRLDGEIGRLSLRMGLARPRSYTRRHRGDHAQTSERLRRVDEFNPLGDARTNSYSAQ